MLKRFRKKASVALIIGLLFSCSKDRYSFDNQLVCFAISARSVL